MTRMHGRCYLPVAPRPAHGRPTPRSLSLSRAVVVAERAGFEPAKEREPLTRLAGECLQPLGHLSRGARGSVEAASGAAGARRTPASRRGPVESIIYDRLHKATGGVAERSN